MDFKKYGILAGIGAVLLLGGYAAGRYAAPERVVVTEKVKVVEVEKIVRVVETDKVVEALKNYAQQKDVKTKKVTVKKPDGTVTTTTETEDKTKTESQEKTKEAEKTKTAETIVKEVIVEKEVTKTIERERPKWSLGLQTGLNYPSILGSADPYTLLPTDNLMLRHVVVGVSVEHRLIGPLSTGLWANTQGAGGISLRLEF